MQRALDNISCEFDPKVKVNGQILNFLVNASLNVVTSNSIGT